MGRSEEFYRGIHTPDSFSLSEAKNDEGEWTMSPEQIRAESNYTRDPYDDYDPYEH